MAAPEYMNDLRKRLQLVDLVSRHDMSEVYETQFFLNNHDICYSIHYNVTYSGNVCQLRSLNSLEDGVYKSQSQITRAALFWKFIFQCRTTVIPDNTTEIKMSKM